MKSLLYFLLCLSIFFISCERANHMILSRNTSLGEKITHSHEHYHIHKHSPEHPHEHEHEHTHTNIDDLIHSFNIKEEEIMNHIHTLDCPVYHQYCLDNHIEFSDSDLGCLAEQQKNIANKIDSLTIIHNIESKRTKKLEQALEHE